ncbi:hypothetical protein RchiOBHm_Chr4g0386631 [Rosa chinensis]|uniref:Uncharacterized protein n=1 Tax=Rosa chinensis TaxID=74649 RepID=A0A2P6QPB8_ROSCH|nr:hypothetical protein RchiOBHm_Chr4g0386631 [Rosa chinensis]
MHSGLKFTRRICLMSGVLISIMSGISFMALLSSVKSSGSMQLQLVSSLYS